MIVDSTKLTPKELEILKWVSLGLSNGDIAARQGVKLKTVCTHLNNIYSKMNVHSRTAAMVKYLKGDINA